MCNLDESCFFCNLRSSCLRLRQIREKGPRSLKVNEYICQLEQYEKKLEWNWRDDKADIFSFVENTFKLLMLSEINLSSQFINSGNFCQNCTPNDERISLRARIDVSPAVPGIKDIVNLALTQAGICQECKKFDNLEDKCMVIQLSQPVSVNLNDQEIQNGAQIVYKSHIENAQNIKTFFRYDNKMYTQNDEDKIDHSTFGIHKDVMIICVYISKPRGMLSMRNFEDFVYGKNDQLKLHRQYLKYLSPKRYKEQQSIAKEYEKVRNLCYEECL